MASSSNHFKRPSLVPQDLQLIQSLIGDIPTPSPNKDPSRKPKNPLHNESVDDDISSSADEDSEREVEEDILKAADEEVSLPSRSPVP